MAVETMDDMIPGLVSLLRQRIDGVSSGCLAQVLQDIADGQQLAITGATTLKHLGCVDTRTVGVGVEWVLLPFGEKVLRACQEKGWKRWGITELAHIHKAVKEAEAMYATFLLELERHDG